MVHKKYIKLGRKTYGPYYYESYRENGKIKKRYIKSIDDKLKRRVKIPSAVTAVYISIVAFLILTTALFYFAPLYNVDSEFILPKILFSPPGASTGFDNNANLSIYDSTDTGENRFSNIPVVFYANYTDNLGNVINSGNGDCDIKYDYTGSYGAPEQMNFNSLSLLWEIVKTFNYKGSHLFEVSCTSSFGNVVLDNLFIIQNTVPRIKTDQGGGFIDIDGNPLNNDFLLCVEDTLCNYSFSSAVVEVDVNDVLSFGSVSGPNTTLTNFTIDSDTGILEVAVTHDDYTGKKTVELSVRDTGTPVITQTGVLNVNITAVNDAPIFINLADQSFNRSTLFDYYIAISDEENNIPLELNISFMNCSLVQWSTKTDCSLFNSSQYLINETNYAFDNAANAGGSINISFIPTRNDVGVYAINFSAVDSGNPNAMASKVVNFTVVNLNEDPYFRYVCDNERQAVESVPFRCEINASDLDEINNLTFISNQPWFLSYESIPVNVTTNFNATLVVSFTAEDINVGNWSINVSVMDTGSPVGINSSLFYFFVQNTNDAVSMQNLGVINAYTSNNYVLYFNATDDDLLIPDKSVYNEALIFSSNASWVNVQSFNVIPDSNITVFSVSFDPNNALTMGIHNINISVRDANSFSSFSRNLAINIIGNFAPIWLNPQANHLWTEDANIYLNLSENVSDTDPITFSFYSNNDFLTFSINPLTGVIDFTPIDYDVGQHIVIINATDIATGSPFAFNFTVLNINDIPLIQTPLTLVENATVDSSSNMLAFEDARVKISFFAVDDDLFIPEDQRMFYDEMLSVSTILEGSNTNLFNFVKDFLFIPGPGDENKELYTASFSPRKRDIGLYNITLTINDQSNASYSIQFNLTITEINHNPEIINLTDQATTVNRTLYYDINATDIEEGDDILGRLTFSYVFLNDGRTDDFINSDPLIFDPVFGILNVSFFDGQAGSYHLNITVNDSSGLKGSDDFWIYVYELPEILAPQSAFIFNMAEGKQSNLTFIANSTGLGNLTYQLYIDNNFRQSINYYGDGTPLIWEFSPLYVDETYGSFGNLTLLVLIPRFEYLNVSKTWRANITHTNSPFIFYNNIGDKQATHGTPIIINLSEHFFDADVFDTHYNQSFQFIAASDANSNGATSAISSLVSLDWLLTLGAGSVVTEILNVTGADLVGNGSIVSKSFSNNFKVRFTEPEVIKVPEPVPTTGGGSSGSSSEKPVSLRIIVPGPISAKQGDRVIIPIGLVNDGKTTLNGVSLSTSLFLNSLPRNDLEISLSNDFIPVLSSGAKENLSLTVQLAQGELGIYEINIDADVSTPDYSDSAKIFINVDEGDSVFEKIIFTEEFIVENPECLELKELVDEALEYLAAGDNENAEIKLEEAINSCKKAISQQSLFSKSRLGTKFQSNVFIYLLIATAAAIVLGAAYYVYRRIVFTRALEAVSKLDSGTEKPSFNRTFNLEKV